MSAPRKLTDEQYAQIIAAYLGPETSVSIGRRFGVSPTNVYHIVRRRRVPFKANRNKRQQIIRLSIECPELGPTAIAKLLGANKKYVNRVRTACGFTKRKHVAPFVAPTTNDSGLQSVAR